MGDNLSFLLNNKELWSSIGSTNLHLVFSCIAQNYHSYISYRNHSYSCNCARKLCCVFM